MSELRTAPSPITVCTLWENDSYKGVGALVNSLIRAGYRGRVWAGYRGKPPDWGPVIEADDKRFTLSVTDEVQLVFVRLDTTIPLTQYQPSFMLTVLTNLDTNAEGVYYFDPAILVLAKWNFFEKWLKFGIAACEDLNSNIHPNHPLVRLWQDSKASTIPMDWNPPRVYLNNCVVGIRREWGSFLHLWQELLSTKHEDLGTTDIYEARKQNIDSDALTIATGFSTIPTSWVGIDGLGLGRGEWLTIHAASKPWRRRVFFELATQGRRPDTADRLYWSLAAGPIPVEKTARIRRHRWLLRLTAALGRFYGGR